MNLESGRRWKPGWIPLFHGSTASTSLGANRDVKASGLLFAIRVMHGVYRAGVVVQHDKYILLVKNRRCTQALETFVVVYALEVDEVVYSVAKEPLEVVVPSHLLGDAVDLLPQ